MFAAGMFLDFLPSLYLLLHVFKSFFCTQILLLYPILLAESRGRSSSKAFTPTSFRSASRDDQSAIKLYFPGATISIVFVVSYRRVQLPARRAEPETLDRTSPGPVLPSIHTDCGYLLGFLLAGRRRHSRTHNARSHYAVNHIVGELRSSGEPGSSIVRQGAGRLDGHVHHVCVRRRPRVHLRFLPGQEETHGASHNRRHRSLPGSHAHCG